jgi:hypothetical protein
MPRLVSRLPRLTVGVVLSAIGTRGSARQLRCSGRARRRLARRLDLVVVVTAGYYQEYSPRAQQVLAGVFRDASRAASPQG